MLSVCLHLDPGLPANGNKFLLFISFTVYAVYGILLWQPEWTRTGGIAKSSSCLREAEKNLGFY